MAVPTTRIVTLRSLDTPSVTAARRGGGASWRASRLMSSTSHMTEALASKRGGRRRIGPSAVDSVPALRPSETVADARVLMAGSTFTYGGHVAVVDDGRFVGAVAADQILMADPDPRAGRSGRHGDPRGPLRSSTRSPLRQQQLATATRSSQSSTSRTGSSASCHRGASSRRWPTSTRRTWRGSVATSRALRKSGWRSRSGSRCGSGTARPGLSSGLAEPWRPQC